MLEARLSIQTLRPYHPPLSDRAGLLLDFNENVAGCSPSVLAALRGLTATDLATYPDRTRGERFVAQHLDLDPAQILLTNGVDEAIHLIAETYLQPNDEVIISIPTFAMYEVYARAAAAKIVGVPAKDNFQFPVADVLAAISPRTKLIAIANPNNPTGSVVSQSGLVQIARAAPDVALLVDEAYYEFHGQTILPEIENLPNLFVARTFSKAYGMAGLRVGAIAAPADKIDMLRKVSSPYNVNAAALACLAPVLEDQSYVRAYVAEVIAGRTKLEEIFRDLAIEYWPSQANFVLARFGSLRLAFVRSMRERGILVRDRDSDPGCSGCVRITLGNAPRNAQLFTTLRTVVDLLRAKPSTL